MKRSRLSWLNLIITHVRNSAKVTAAPSNDLTTLCVRFDHEHGKVYKVRRDDVYPLILVHDEEDENENQEDKFGLIAAKGKSKTPFFTGETGTDDEVRVIEGTKKENARPVFVTSLTRNLFLLCTLYTDAPLKSCSCMRTVVPSGRMIMTIKAWPWVNGRNTPPASAHAYWRRWDGKKARKHTTA